MDWARLPRTKPCHPSTERALAPRLDRGTIQPSHSRPESMLRPAEGDPHKASRYLMHSVHVRSRPSVRCELLSLDAARDTNSALPCLLDRPDSSAPALPDARNGVVGSLAPEPASCCLPRSQARSSTRPIISSRRACSIVQTAAAPALPDARKRCCRFARARTCAASCCLPRSQARLGGTSAPHDQLSPCLLDRPDSSGARSTRRSRTSRLGPFTRLQPKRPVM